MSEAADQVVINSVRRWFENAVLGLNLCPFAAAPYKKGALRFELSQAANDENCLIDLYLNLDRLDKDREIESIILICQQHLIRFSDYNQFLSLADQMLVQEGWQGIYQIASFHPDYRFADAPAEDPAHWTNRSPYPLLHLLRESSIDAAVNACPNIGQIPEQNIEKLRSLTPEQMQAIFGAQFTMGNQRSMS